MKTGIFVLIAVLLVVSLAGYELFGHCQIPCGIYDDPVRFTLLEEHCTTIEKSMKEIVRISGSSEPNWNQVVRWTKNKELHADELSHIVTHYFMAQRLKPAEVKDREAHTKYVRELTMLHRMVVHAMKAKQTTDLNHVEALRSLIASYKASYFDK